MKSESTRPNVKQFGISLYSRPIHPELIDVVAFRRLQSREYTLTVRLTPAGHLISWDSGPLHLSEVAAPEGQPLPDGGRLLHRQIHGEQTDTVIPQAGFCYQMSCQVESLTEELFPFVHAEILAEADRGGLLHFLPPDHRLAHPPVSLVVHEAGDGYVSVATFHTFPHELAVLKSQSLFEYGL